MGCDHEFADSVRCVKCGWRPGELPSTDAWLRVFEALGELYQDGRVSLELCDQLSRAIRIACDDTTSRHLRTRVNDADAALQTTERLLAQIETLARQVALLHTDLLLADEALDSYAGQSLAGYKALVAKREGR